MSKTLCVGITNRCNARCIMCGSQEKDVERGDMTPEIFDALLAKIPGDYGLEFNSLGEPTMNPSFLDFIAKAATKKKNVKIATNGMWPYDDAQIVAFADTLAKTRSEVNFSIDGNTKEIYEKIRRGCNHEKVFGKFNRLMELRRGRFKVGVGWCYMAGNGGEASRFIEQHPGLDSFYLNLLIISGPRVFDRSLYASYPDAMKDIARIIETCNRGNVALSGNCLPGTETKPSCSFPGYLWMDWQGNLYPCCRRWDMPLGNIVTDDWQAMVGGAKIDHAHDFCQTCLTPCGHWSWRQHFATREIYEEFKSYLANDQRGRSIKACRQKRDKETPDLIGLLDILAKWKDENHSILYILRIFNKFRGLIERFGGLPDVDSVVELGHGFTKLAGRLFSECGIQYHGVEPWNDINIDDDLTDAFLEAWRPILFPHEPEYTPTPNYYRDISQVPSGQDVLFSNAVLEHVDDPRGIIRETARVIRAGGLVIHQVDLSDHRRIEPPDEFQKHKGERWPDIKYSYGGINGLNRGEWLAIFDENGLDVIDLQIQSFAGLAEGSFQVILQKRDNG